MYKILCDFKPKFKTDYIINEIKLLKGCKSVNNFINNINLSLKYNIIDKCTNCSKKKLTISHVCFHQVCVNCFVENDECLICCDDDLICCDDD